MYTKLFWVGLVLSACTAADETDALDTDDTDVVDTAPACVALVDGAWSGSGAAFGMRMGVTLTMDSEGCSFTLTDWDMDMGPIADAGTVADDQVTLSGPDSYWATCTGTATADGTSVDGLCADDGAAFALEHKP